MKGGRYLEDRHVRKVYDTIAPSFNDIPQKVWPNVKKFIKGLDPGAIVADIGCGNGRYLHINQSLYKVGVDACLPLIELSKVKGYEVLAADNLSLPFRDSAFDAVLSIGVLHHFSTKERRIKALKELCRILRPGGKLMLYVWAYEQKHRKFDGQDVLVPWQSGKKTKGKGIFSSDQDMSSTSSLSEDDSIDLPSADHLIQRTVSDPDCPCGQQLQTSMLNKLLTSTVKPISLRQRSNTLPSSLEALSGHNNENGQIEEECRKLQESLRELAASHDQLSGSNDSVFCSNDKLDNEQDQLVFETQSLCQNEGPSRELDEENKPEIPALSLLGGEQPENHPDNNEVPHITATCDMNCNPDLSYNEVKQQKNHKMDKKPSLFESLKKRFLKFIDSKFDNEAQAKTETFDGDGNKEGIIFSDHPLQSFAVREFPMSSYPDYRKMGENRFDAQSKDSADKLSLSIEHGLHQNATENYTCDDSDGMLMVSASCDRACEENAKVKVRHESSDTITKAAKKLTRYTDICEDENVTNDVDVCYTKSLNGKAAKKLTRYADVFEDENVTNSVDVCYTKSMNGAHNTCDTQKCNTELALNGLVNGECNKVIHSDIKCPIAVKKYPDSKIGDVKGKKNPLQSLEETSKSNLKHEASGKFVNGQMDLSVENTGKGDHLHLKSQNGSLNGSENSHRQLENVNSSEVNFTQDVNHVKIQKYQAEENHIQKFQTQNQNCIARNGCTERLSSSQNDLPSYDSRSFKSGAESVPSLHSTVEHEEFQMSSTRLCRFYHVFKQGELSNLVQNHLDDLSVISCTYDHGNWCLIACKK